MSLVSEQIERIEERTASLSEGKEGGFAFTRQEPEDVVRMFFNGYVEDPEVVEELLEAIDTLTHNGAESMMKAGPFGALNTFGVLIGQAILLGILVGKNERK